MFGHLSKALEWRWIPLCNPGSTSKIQPEACVNIRDLQLFLQLVEKVPHQGDDGISVTKGTVLQIPLDTFDWPRCRFCDFCDASMFIKFQSCDMKSSG